MSANPGVWLEDLTWLEAKARFGGGRARRDSDRRGGQGAWAAFAAQDGRRHCPRPRPETDRAPARGGGSRWSAAAAFLPSPRLPGGAPTSRCRHLQGVACRVARRRAAWWRAWPGRRIAGCWSRACRRSRGRRTTSDGGRRDRTTGPARWRRPGAAADRLLDASEGGHADERETSVMLALETAQRAREIGWNSMARSRRRAPRRSEARYRLQGRAHPQCTNRRHCDGDRAPLAGSGLEHTGNSFRGMTFFKHLNPKKEPRHGRYHEDHLGSLIAAEKVDGTDVYNLAATSLAPWTTS